MCSTLSPSVCVNGRTIWMGNMPKCLVREKIQKIVFFYCCLLCVGVGMITQVHCICMYVVVAVGLLP